MKRTVIALRLMLIGSLCHVISGVGLWAYQEGHLSNLLHDDYAATNFFMLFDNLFKLALSASIYALVTEPKSLKILAALVLGFVLNDVLDEMFFDPEQMQANEIIFTMLIALTTLFIWKKKTTL